MSAVLNSATRAIVAFVCVIAWCAPTLGADLDRHFKRGVEKCDPRWYGTAAPWSVQEERPPRKGAWYFTAPLPPGVNYLVPMGDENCFQRPAPWTQAWYDYCSARWDSFDPNTGTIVTPDGVRMCM